MSCPASTNRNSTGITGVFRRDMSGSQKLFLLTLLCLSLLEAGCKNDFEPPPAPGPPWFVLTKSNSSLLDNKINALARDAEGKIWMATDSGACAYSNRNWSVIRDSLDFLTYFGDTSYITRTVTSIAVGKDQSIWFALLGGGAARYRPSSSDLAWHRYKYETDGLVFNTVLSVAAEIRNPGNIWFATRLGVSRYTPSADPYLGVWSTFNLKNTPELKSDQISLVVTNINDNSMWFGTQPGVVVRCTYDMILRWVDRSPPGNRWEIKSIAFDPLNNEWIGTIHDVWKHIPLEGKWVQYTYYSTKGKLPDGPVNAIVANSTKSTWLGTNGGLVHMKDTTWLRFTKGNSPLPCDTVTALLFDYSGNLWIGTANGIAAYNADGVKF